MEMIATNEMEEYDDDVIFYNSPLYKHLSEVNAGILNDEMCQNVEQSQTYGQKHLEKFVKEHTVRTWKDYWQLVRNCMATLLKHLFYYKMIQCEKADQIYSRYYTHLMCTSKSLEEDDLLFVEQLLGDEIYTNVTVTPPYSRTWLCVIAVSLISVMIAVINFHLCTLYLMLGVIFLILYLGVLYQIAAYCSCHEECIVAIEMFLEQKHLMKSFMQKCVRLIQELELVGRGFTLINNQLPVSRLESSSSSRQGLAIRRLLFAVAKNTVLKFRQQTLNFISTYPLCPDLDSSDLYMSAIPMSEFSRSLDKIEDDELEELTDGYSLAAIKSVTQLCNLQMSEFIRRLTISLSVSLHNKSSASFKLLIKNLTDSLSLLTHSLKEDHTSLERCSKLYRNAFCARPERKTLQEGDNNFPIFTAVHSLGLHLLSALTKEDQVFEAFTSDTVNTELSDENWFMQDTEQNKAQKEESMRVLEELKSILSVRAAEWKEREKLAKQRAGIDEDQNNDTTDVSEQSTEFSNVESCRTARNVHTEEINGEIIKDEASSHEKLDNVIDNDGTFSSQLSPRSERDADMAHLKMAHTFTSNIAVLAALKSKQFQMKLDTYDATGEAATNSSSDPEEG